MSGKEHKKEDREQGATPEPKGFAGMCESMMTAEPGCGPRMQEMMSRCMASFSEEETEPD